MSRFRKFLNDLREPLGIGMKRLMIALAIILGIVIIAVGGWLLWSRIGLADALTALGVQEIYEEVGNCICFEQAWKALGDIPQGILYAPDTENVPSWYHRVQLDDDWYYYWIP